MVSSLRPQDYKKTDDNQHHNVVLRDAVQHHRYYQHKIDRLKFSLIVLSTLLFILGGAAFGMSVFGLIRYEVLGYSELFKSVTLATIIPWIGAISSTLAITMVPLCGCHGAVSQRKSQLVLFFLFLLLMLLLDLVMCIWIVTTADKIQSGITSSVRTAVDDYYTNPVTKRAIDDLQMHLGCCGSDHGVIDHGLRGPPPSCVHQYLFTPCNLKMQQIYENYRFKALGAFAAMAAILMSGIVIVIMLLGAMKRRRPPRPRAPDRPRPEITVIDATNSASAPQSRVSKNGGQQTGVVQLANTHNEASVV